MSEAPGPAPNTTQAAATDGRTPESAYRRAALSALVASLDEKFGKPDPAEVERFARKLLPNDPPAQLTLGAFLDHVVGTHGSRQIRTF